MNIIKMNCPNCGAPLAFGDSISKVTCEHCGQSFTIDDKASEIDRVSAAEAEAAKRNAEAQRRQMEMRLEEEKRRNDEKLRVEHRKSLSSYLPILIVLALFVIMAMGLGISSCISSHKREAELAALADKGIENGINVPSNKYSYLGENYQAVQMSFEAAGFTNIETVPLGDLVTGLLSSDGEVSNVTINGGDFSEGEQFAPDALVVISYHSYPDRSSNETTESTETFSDVYDEASYQATTLGNIMYVFPVEWSFNIESGNRVSYTNPAGTIEMIVSVTETEASINDDGFDESISDYCGDIFAGEYEISYDRIREHDAKRIDGTYSGSEDVNARVYLSDYSDGILSVGFLIHQDEEAGFQTLQQDLMNSFVFAGREEIVYTSANIGNTAFEVPEDWEITQQSSNSVNYMSPDDNIIFVVSYQSGDMSIQDDSFVSDAENQISWDDLSIVSADLNSTEAYYISGINNDDGGYMCKMYMADSEPGIVSIGFYYYPEFDLLYEPVLEHIVSSIDIQG